MRLHHVYDRLAILGLLWRWVMRHYAWSSRGATSHPRPADPLPLTSKRHRSNAPTPFEGLTPKPPCALCARDPASPQPAPPVPLDPMPPTNRRPRKVDTAMHFCPHSDCDYRGWLGLGNLRANGHPSGGPWRQFHCTSCKGYFLETHGTIFHGQQASVERIVHV